jgi:TRAP-type C4-dicarboxylate transport system permease small subunit
MKWADYGLLAITGGVLVFLTCMIFVDICLRFLFNSPLPASAESTELMMPYIAFGALSYTLSLGAHIRITLLNERVSRKVRVFLEIIACFIGGLFSAYLTYKGWLFFWESFVIREEMLAIIKLPWWAGKFAMPLGMFFFTLRFFYRLIAVLSGHLDRLK